MRIEESNEPVTYDVDYNKGTGYYEIVSSDGERFGEFLEYDDALDVINPADEEVKELPEEEEESDIDEVSKFTKDTGLRLTKYGSRYIETSGTSYSKIQRLVRDYNKKNGTHITLYNDDFKDATFIYFN